MPLLIKPKSKGSDKRIPYFLSLAVSLFIVLYKLICFVKGVGRFRREKGGRWAGEDFKLPRPSRLRQTVSPGMPFLYSVIFCFILFLKMTFSHSVFLKLCSSPLVWEGFISLTIFQKQLLFLPDLDLRAVGYRLSSSELPGILRLIKAH